MRVLPSNAGTFRAKQRSCSECREDGLKVNTPRPNSTQSGSKCSYINGRGMEEVKEFTYLGT